MAALAQINQATDSDDFDIANRLFFRLYQSSNLMHKVGTRAVSGLGSTTQQWAVLGALGRPKVRSRGMSVKELIEFLLVSRQNLSVVLERLEVRGWIERVQDRDDRRSRRIKLSDQGHAQWTTMLTTIAEFYAAALEDFTSEEALVLARLLGRLKDGLQALAGDRDEE